MFPQEASVSTPEPQPVVVREKSPILMYVLLAAAAIYVIASLYLMYDMRTRILGLEQKSQALDEQQAVLQAQLHATSAQLQQELSSELGLTKQQMEQRAAQLESAQKAAAARIAAEAAQQKQQGQQIAAVSSDVSSVKTDVGSAKTDIQKTQTDLAATNAKLEKTIGDLGLQSGLIAHNASELAELKRKGERNYYDFTLHKNQRTPVGTISLVLKKVDPKKSKFTLNVIADDKTIEKKDRTLNEPLQFYTGRDHMLYELVVFTAAKNEVTGYLATPKNAPTPITP